MYAYIKLLHILGAVLFLGNIIVTAVWMTLANRTTDPRVIAYAQQLVGKTDRYFTGPGAIFVLATGVYMAMAGGRALFHATWVMWGAGLFGVSGILWFAVLLPTQRRQSRLARQFADGGDIPDDYWTLARRWTVFGSISTLSALGTLWFMVVRPA
jgi:uncharacterized membrane protein